MATMRLINYSNTEESSFYTKLIIQTTQFVTRPTRRTLSTALYFLASNSRLKEPIKNFSKRNSTTTEIS